eukprot:m.43501 g.43501  ORF g.43501 m.43501 type:complete len:99 (+) comp15058_c0_seq2:45-341(+)
MHFKPGLTTPEPKLFLFEHNCASECGVLEQLAAVVDSPLQWSALLRKLQFRLHVRVPVALPLLQKEMETKHSEKSWLLTEGKLRFEYWKLQRRWVSEL